MTERVDLVRELIDRMIEASARQGGLTKTLATEVESKFRQEHRGKVCEIYESPRALLPQKRAVVVDAYLQGRPVDEIAQSQGISRATLYRYLKVK